VPTGSLKKELMNQKATIKTSTNNLRKTIRTK